MKKKIVVIEIETDYSNEFLKKIYQGMRLEGTIVKQVQVNLIKKEEKRR